MSKPIKTMNDYGLGGLLSFWESMTQDEREELIANIEEYNELKQNLKIRGIISIDKTETEIVCNEDTKEVRHLIELRDKVNAQSVNIILPPKK